MRRVTIVLAAALLGMLALLAGERLRSAHAQSALAEYAIGWFTIDSGGAMASSGGSYTLSGTIGQPDAGRMSSGEYALSGGFWAGSEARYTVALPIAAR